MSLERLESVRAAFLAELAEAGNDADEAREDEPAAEIVETEPAGEGSGPVKDPLQWTGLFHRPGQPPLSALELPHRQAGVGAAESETVGHRGPDAGIIDALGDQV